MSHSEFDKSQVIKVWIALKRLDKNVENVPDDHKWSKRKQVHLTLECCYLRKYPGTHSSSNDRVVALREVSIPLAADVTVIRQIIMSTFGLNSSDLIFKIRNQRSCLIPLNSFIPANSKHKPYVLEVSKIFQHVFPRPKIIPTTVINKTMKTRLQHIDTRIQRLDDLLPQINLRRNEKLAQEIECLNQKLGFLQKRMQVADSHSWKGTLTRAPLW